MNQRYFVIPILIIILCCIALYQKYDHNKQLIQLKSSCLQMKNMNTNRSSFTDILKSNPIINHSYNISSTNITNKSNKELNTESINENKSVDTSETARIEPIKPVVRNGDKNEQNYNFIDHYESSDLEDIPTVELSEKESKQIRRILNERTRQVYPMWRNLSALSSDAQRSAMARMYPIELINSPSTDNNTLLTSHTYVHRTNQFLFKYTENSYMSHNQYSDFPDPSYSWVYPQDTVINKKHVSYETYAIQNYIWKHQHPKSCKNARIMFVPSILAGLGAQIHVFSEYLSLALDNDYILNIYPQSTTEWIDKEFCTLHSLECYLEPFSGCSFDEKTMFDWDIDNIKDYANTNYAVLEKIEDLHKYRNKQYIIIQNSMHNFGLLKKSVPKFFTELLSRSLPGGSLQIAYWRAQSTTYFMRPNKMALEWMDNYEKDNCVNCKSHYDMSIHIRHGDKGSEMLLVDVRNYIYPIQVMKSIFNKKNLDVFINADDEHSMDYLKHLNYTFSYYETATRQNMKAYALRNQKNIVLISLVNLRQQVRGKSMVGTNRSNWCRLINELRYTVGYQDFGYYMEVGDAGCTSEHHCKIKGAGYDHVW